MENPGKLSIDEANSLVEEHHGWAESISRSVARAWNLDWRLDGLDGAAMEALIFCSRRFDPARGVPFKGYARKRIHEASTDAARKSRGWRKGLGANSKSEQHAREISAELFNIFPELRSGQLPTSDEGSGDSSGGGGGGDDEVRGAIRQLLVGASFLSAREGIEENTPEDLLDLKRMLSYTAQLEAVHQILLWKVYWEGLSMRNVASEWEIDELNVIREHKNLLLYLQKSFQKGKSKVVERPRVRPGLKDIALKLKREGKPPPFQSFLASLSA